MLSLIKRIGALVTSKGEHTSVVATSSRALPFRDIERDDIPRYPPFIRGFPAVDVIHLLEMQAELIDEIRSTLGLRHEDFNELFLPLIHNLASYVHLLPASESHHHRGAGGLFRHSLEVCLNAAKISKQPIFAIDGSPQFRRDTEPLWRMACAVAGLLHDIGKPVTDMIVTNKDGSLMWSSYEYTLLHEWLTAHNIDRFFLTWNKNRHKEHESAAHLVFKDLMPKQMWTHLAKKDPRVFKALSDAVLIQSRIGNKVAEMMSLADRSSVRADMQTQNIDMDQFALGIPVERYVFDGIRRLVNSGKWSVNQQGGRVWHLKQGTFIAWRSLSDLYLLLDDDKIPGIPRDPATLADLLIDGGFCQPQVMNVNGEERSRRYWEVQPEGVPAKIEMLLFNSHTYVFTSEPPAPIDAQIEGMDSEPAVIEFLNTQTGEIVFGTANMASETMVPVDDEQNTPQRVVSEPRELVVSSVPTTPAVSETTAHPEPEVVNERPSDDQFNADSAQFTADTNSEKPVTEEQLQAAAKAANDVLSSVGMSSALGMFDVVPAQQVVEPEPGSPVSEPAPSDLVPNADEPSIGTLQSNCTHEYNLPGIPDKQKSSTKTTGNSVEPLKPTTQIKPVKQPEPLLVTDLGSAEKTPSQTEVPPPPGQQFEELLAQYPRSKPFLQQLAQPGNAQNQLINATGNLAIPFPAGIRALGEQDEVLLALRTDKAIELDPIMPGTGVRLVAGVRCLVFNSAISLALAPLLPKEGVTSSSPTAGTQRPAKAQPRGKAEATTKLPASTSKKLVEAARPELPVQTPAPSPKKKPSKTQVADKPVIASERPSQAEPRTAESATKKPKQNYMPGKPVNKKDTPAIPDTASKPVNRGGQPLSLGADNEKTERDERQRAREAELEALARTNPTVTDVIKSFREMVERGKGRWLVGSVVTNGKTLETSVLALDRISEEHPKFGKQSLRTVMRGYGFVVDRKTIYLKQRGQTQQQSGEN